MRHVHRSARPPTHSPSYSRRSSTVVPACAEGRAPSEHGHCANSRDLPIATHHSPTPARFDGSAVDLHRLSLVIVFQFSLRRRAWTLRRMTEGYTAFRLCRSASQTLNFVLSRAVERIVFLGAFVLVSVAQITRRRRFVIYAYVHACILSLCSLLLLYLVTHVAARWASVLSGPASSARTPYCAEHDNLFLHE